MPRVSKKVKPVVNIPEECDDDCKKRIINEVITQVYPQLVVNSYKTATDDSPWLKDILPHAILVFLEKPLDYQWKVVLDGKVENFITYVMAFQLKSGNSPFYVKYRKYDNKWDRNVDIDTDETGKFGSEIFDVFNEQKTNKELIAEKVYAQLNFYEQNIIQKIWIEGWSQIRFAEYYGIPYTEFLNNVCSLKNKIKKIVKTKYAKYI